MRKIPFILFGLIAVAVILVALKVFATLFTFMPRAEKKVDRKTEIARLLDDLMLEENGNAARMYWTTSMGKLAKMGEPIVPDLIEAIETAGQRAESVEYEGRTEWGINHDREMLQVRVVMVLGRIGDVRALPVLTNLDCKGSFMMCFSVDEALKNIREQEQKKLNSTDDSDCTNPPIAKPKVHRRLGVLNAYATNFPKPTLSPFDMRGSQPEPIKVEIVVDAGTGKIVWARIENGAPVLQAAIRKVICQVRFAPIELNGAPIYLNGYLVYESP
jgi:hypothetical protein